MNKTNQRELQFLPTTRDMNTNKKESEDSECMILQKEKRTK